MHLHAMNYGDLGGQFCNRQVPRRTDPPGNPVLQPLQLAMPAATALTLGRKTPGPLLQLAHQ